MSLSVEIRMCGQCLRPWLRLIAIRARIHLEKLNRYNYIELGKYWTGQLPDEVVSYSLGTLGVILMC